MTKAHAVLDLFAGSPKATIIGRGRSSDCLTAAYLNSMSSGVHTYDDTHLKTVAHPTGPIAAALFALAEQKAVTGVDFLAALAIGIEIACRLGNALFVPPARCHIGFSMTGLTCGIGAAAACGRLLGLEEQQMAAALGIAAIQSAGFRETHQSEAAYLTCAHAARSGVMAAFMARQGITCSEASLEGPNGFLSVFGSPPSPEAALADLGFTYEIADLAYKPYPCGIVLHPSIDVCLEAAARVPVESIVQVELDVPPITMSLARQPDPQTSFAAQVSLHHWCAAALVRKAAGLQEGSLSCVADPAIAAMRRLINVSADEALRNDEGRGRFLTKDGNELLIHVPHCRGSAQRPLTDEDLARKFLGQAVMILPADEAQNLLADCRDLHMASNVGELARRYFPMAAEDGQRTGNVEG